MALTPSTGSHDVIVIGGGPSGSVTAYRLAKAGVRVLLIDAKRFPREKACGGGIQFKGAQKIPFEWDSVKRGTLSGGDFSFRFSDRFSRTYSKPLVYSVLRYQFDEFLLRSAEAAGVQLVEGFSAKNVLETDKGVSVETERGVFNARFAVGADGANGISRRSINARADYFWQSGLYCEIPEGDIISGKLNEPLMRIDWGTLPSGYGWIFPKQGSVNVGVGCPNQIARIARPYFNRFIEREQLLKPGVFDKTAVKGHQLPTLTHKTRFSSRNTLLVGDAAGLVEPFTGDGISAGLHSAEIAAEVIVRQLGTASTGLSEYDRRVRAEIAPEIFLSRKLLSFFVVFPRMVHEIFKHNMKVWTAFCRVLRGEESFRIFRQKKFGAFEFLWLPIDACVQARERRLLNQPPSNSAPCTANNSRIVESVLRRM
ncbi:MAG: NAD(P)/FAD-dependent oxidoreductase [Acidobacteriaceae bacterium]|nr:NAD(P)/FAD-dependent oxidoreductase [Acidobacteriaceae bacterium]